MNNVYDKGYNTCCSCGVCSIACPAKCITISQDKDGFYRPRIDENKCTSCGICKKVCYQYLETKEPFVNYFHDKEIYGAWSKDDQTRLTCTSGGVGHELISYALNNGYKACGVIFEAEKDLCKHEIISDIKDAEKFKTSKYLQSYTIDAFSQFKKDEKYIVVGTPCQINGLRQYIKIKKWDDNFILIDFFCHGTPSYLLWRKYKQYIKQKYGLANFKEVVFRSKEKSSWHKNAMKISDQKNKTYHKDRAFANDLFFNIFLSDTCLNESCYNCLLRLDNCSSDIRLADFWGPKYQNSNKGVSLITINNIKGNSIWKEIRSKITFEKCTFNDIEISQPNRFLKINKKRDRVLDLLKNNYSLIYIYIKHIYINCFYLNFIQKSKSILKHFVR